MPDTNHLMEIEARRAEIIREFIAHPDLSDYFYDREFTKDARPLEDRKERARLYALCELFLTHFSMIVRLGTMANYQPSSVWNPHKATITKFFERSEVLRNYYKKHSSCFHEGIEKFLPIDE